MKLNDRQIQILQKLTKEKDYLLTAQEINTEYVIAKNTARNNSRILHNLELLAIFKSGNVMTYGAANDLLQRLNT
ncbi:hypothetical protein [Aggregatibacter kilianii]|uniref:hypothetical protein n=1 Tax=Aggregatibacter kilianii TaxID=2025884 RepID=UPI000D690A5A|nr:hypothetical protein [Aggregatibacter kilianii]